MSLNVKSTQDLTKTETFRLKMLIYGISGVGKTLFCGTAPKPIIAACETGHGNGLLTLASSTNPIAYCTPSSYDELELFCSGNGLEKYDTVIVDGFSYLTDTLIRDKTLTINTRAQGNSGKRAAGILELDDYGILAEYERRLLARLLMLDKNVVVSCLQNMYQPYSASPPRAEKMGGPDLPGQMQNGSAAMFDIVMKLGARRVLADPRNPKSAYLERFFLTESDGSYICKSRLRNGTKAIFPSEVVFDMDKDLGTFKWFHDEAMRAYEGHGK